MNQAFPLRFCILKVIKSWTVGRPGSEASTQSCIHVPQALYHILYETVTYTYILIFFLQLCTTYATNFIVKTQVEALYTHMRVSCVIQVIFVLPAIGANVEHFGPSLGLHQCIIRLHVHCRPSVSVASRD